MIAKLFVLWLFYLLVTGQLAQWIGFATTTASDASTSAANSSMLPQLMSLPNTTVQ